MSFFKDFKADFTQAVNELIPDSEELASEYDDEDMVNTFDEAEKELTKKSSKKKSGFFGAFAKSDDEEMISEDDDDIEIAAEDLIDDIDDDTESPAEDVQMTLDFAPETSEISDEEDVTEVVDEFAEGEQAEVIADTTEEDSLEEDKIDESVVAFDDSFETELKVEASSEDAIEEVDTNVSEADAQIPADIDAQSMDFLSNFESAVTDENPVDDDSVADENSIDEDSNADEEVVEEVESISEDVQDVDESFALDDYEANNEIDHEPEVLEDVVPESTDEIVETSEVPFEMIEDKVESDSVDTVKEEEPVMIKVEEDKTAEEVFDNETTYITKGTKVTGNIETEGSVDIIGAVVGNVSCKGKLVIGGTVEGNVHAGEVYANAAKIEGDIVCEGSAKVGVGTVVVGKIEGTSAVIAGAVNGDIDVHGPVIVDSTAVIMGNIKSRSVQINNGAVIEGFCSQCYSEIDVKSFFA